MTLHSLAAKLPQAVVGAAVLGAVSSFGDWVWARFIPDGAIVPAIVHGVLFFAVLALVLGWAAGAEGATRRLLPTLPLTGLVLAAAFYPLATAVGYLAALLVSWAAMWIALAFVLRWVEGSGESKGRAVLRAILAALGSGLAFWAVSGMWTRPDPHPDYLVRFLYWTFAFLPGFAALLLRPPRT